MLYDYVAYFFIYGFLGWCVEVIFKALQKGILQNRGFLNGAICPIYGFGVCSVLLLTRPLGNDSLLVLYIGSVIITTLLELVTGFLMDKLFHKRWWDYSTMPLNIHGYVCLLFSLIWGVACVFLIKVLHPLIARFVSWVPHMLKVVILSFLSLLFVVDSVLTILTVLKLNKKISQIDEMSARIKEQSDKITQILYRNAIKVGEKTEKIGDKFAQIREKHKEDKESCVALMKKNNASKEDIDEFKRQHDILVAMRRNNEGLKTLNWIQSRLLKAFPNAKSTDDSAGFEDIKLYISSIAKLKVLERQKKRAAARAAGNKGKADDDKPKK